MHRLLYFTCLVAFFTLFVSCAGDDAGQTAKEPVTVTFAMTSAPASGSGVPQDPVAELEVERFNYYWVVFTDGSAANNIVAIVKKECELTERDEFSVTLSPGRYKVYGFANISGTFLEGLGIRMGESMPDLSNVLFTPDNRFFGNGVTTLLPVETLQADYAAKGNMGIPMTSVNGRVVNITNAVTVDQSVEVVRMFAKLEFVFSNQTGKNMTLRSQSVSNLSVNEASGKGFVPLMNDDERSFSFLDKKPFKTLTHSYGAGLNLPQGISGVSRAFYVLESKADDITNSFMLDFDLVETGATTDAATPLEDYMRYGLTDPNTLTAIRRNDWIRIPVTFADWQMRVEGHSYAPIGGYPEAEVEENESNEFVATFLSGGDFLLRVFIRKYSDGESWFGIDNKSKVEGLPVITVSDPEGLFETAPSLQTTGEIRGKMKPASGKTAMITISVNAITNASPKVIKNLTRKIFITQK